MNYYVIAGEASGDLHGSNLLKELKKLDSSAQFRCWGGDLMLAQGATIIKHYKDLAFMGFSEVLMNLGKILRNIAFCKKDLLNWKPDVLILIDYPGFNLRIAEFAHKHGIKVFYYISPQIWAWKQSRVHKIKKYVDAMFVILPFEQAFYKRFKMDVSFVGHPLMDSIQSLIPNSNFRNSNKLNSNPIIALLPGSRKQEISKMLPVMLEAVAPFTDCQVVIAGAPSLTAEYYQPFINGKPVTLVFGQTYHLLQQSQVAAVTSGTATLETGLFGVPLVVCYKGEQLSYLLARKLIKVKYISLVNLILDRPAVPELIQAEMNAALLSKHIKNLLANTPDRTKQLEELASLRLKCGGTGASERTALGMWELLNK